ncbi:lysophospholipid acyltransferase family protein [Histidinibacterium aquaticum]|uniref:lysophospholipid acyltransferase family protein n=1 Tax=Histidinibacterium aquaticum TaxID=2613962 RepID=UPI00168A843D|nr:lauroyl acyltransferase [Histidinibacterium aquaticum]
MAFKTILAVLNRLPYAWRVHGMGWLATRVIGPLAGYRRRALTNLEMVWPGMPGPERRRLADETLDNFGRTVIENFCHADFAAHLARTGTRVEGPGLPALDAARAEGRPVLFAAAHFGNHEAPRHAFAAQGTAVGGIYRPLSNPYIDRDYRETLNAIGAETFPQGREGTARFARYLRNGGWGILYYDIHQPRGDKLEFMGLPARTSTSAAKLALKHGAALVPVFAVRQPDGLSFRVIVEEPIAPGDPMEMTEALHARLEARIAETPAQWMWIHRRWKSHQKAQARSRTLSS